MTGRASSLHFLTNDNQIESKTGVEVKVKKPSSDSAREIRDQILRDYFGYTASDIKELDAQLPGKFFIVEKGDKSGKEMTADQVRTWLPDANGMISMTLNDYWLKNLSAFHERRVTIVINQAAGAINDSELRGKVTGYLQKLFSQSESERLTALNDLLNETGGSLDSSGQISAALSHLTDKAGYQDNPLLILVKANAALTEYRMKSGPGYDINARTLLAETIRKANSNFIFGSDQSPHSLSRVEAGFVSRYASSLYNQLGDNKEARERDWAARFYEMGDEERAALSEGDMIEFFSPVTAMSKPQKTSDAQSKLEKLNENQAQTQKTWDVTDKIGSQMVPTDHRAGELYQSPTDKYDVRKFRQERGRFQQSGKSLKFNVVMLNENPYSKANV